MRRLLALAFCLLLLSAARAAPELVRQFGPVREYRLDNGLHVLLLPEARQTHTMALLTYRVGSRHEGEGEAGLAHLLEHMTFRGNAAHADLGAELQRLGVRFNGTTTKDRTNYSASFPQSADTLRQVLALEAARMCGASLLAADFAKEKPLVLNEMGLRISSQPQLLAHAVQRTLFRQHPYGRPVIGYSEEIEAFSLDSLRAFYERYYRPDNALLIVAGAFDAAQALDAAEQTLGAVARPQQALSELALPAEPPQRRPRLGTVRGPHTGLALAYRVPGLAHPDAAAVAVLGALMLEETQTQVMGRETPFTAGALNPLLPISREPFLMGVGLSLPTLASDSPQALEALAQIEQRWIERIEGLERSETLDARVRQNAQRLVAALRQQIANPETVARLLSDAYGAGDWRLPLRLLAELGQLKPEAVRRVAGEYLRAENRNLARVLTAPGVGSEPEVQELPVGGFWARLFSRSAQVDTVADPGAELDRLGRGRPPAVAASAASAPAAPPVAASAASQPAVLGVAPAAERRRLAGGLRLATQALPGEMSTLLLELRWGRPEDLRDEVATLAIAQMLMEGGGSGTQRLQGPALRARLQQLGAQLRFAAAPQSLQMQLRAPRERLLPALELAVGLLKEPALPPAALQRMRQAALARIEIEQRHPASAIQEQLRQYAEAQLGAGVLARSRSLDELRRIWQQMEVEPLRAWATRWWSANDARLSVAGALPEGLEAAIERLLGRWHKAENPGFEPERLEHREVPPARFAGPVSPGESGRVLWQQWLPLQESDEDLPALMLGLLVLAGDGSPMGSRLADRLRGREAISYSVSMQLELPRPGLGGGGSNRARVRILASGAPERLAEVEAALPEELRRLQQQGLAADELERVRQRVLTGRRQQLATDSGLAAALLQQLDDADWAHPQPLDGLLQRLQAVSPEQVQQALQRHLRADGFLVLALGGEPAAPSKSASAPGDP